MAHGFELNLFCPLRGRPTHRSSPHFPGCCPGLYNVVAFQAVGKHHFVTLTGSTLNSAHKKSYASVIVRKRMAASSRSQGAALG